MSWVDEWRRAEIDVIVPRRQKDSSLTLLEGGSTSIMIRVHTRDASSTLSASTWYKHRSCVTASCLLHTLGKATIVMQESIVFEPHGEPSSSSFLLRAHCVLHVDAAYVDQPLQLSVHLRIDGRLESFHGVDASSFNYDVVDSILMASLTADGSSQGSPVVRELVFPPSIVLMRPLVLSHVVHHDPLAPPASVVLQLTNAHSDDNITLVDVAFHCPQGHAATGGLPIAQDPPNELFPTTIGPGESFQVVWSVTDWANQIGSAARLAASVTWRMEEETCCTSDHRDVVEDLPTITSNELISVPSSHLPLPSAEGDHINTQAMGPTSLTARWVATAGPTLVSGKMSSFHVHVTNHSVDAMADVVLLLPFHQVDPRPQDLTMSISNPDHARLLAVATHLTAAAAPRTRRFLHCQATHSLGTLGSGCTAVVRVEGIPLAHGAIRIDNAIVYVGGTQTFYRQDRAWDGVSNAATATSSCP